MSDLYRIAKAPAGSTKKWKVKVATPSGGVKTVQFGARGYEDYTQHKDKERRASYRSRHRNDKINDPTAAGFWSWHVLWGDSTSMTKNLETTKKKFRLNPTSCDLSVEDVSSHELASIKEDYRRRSNPELSWHIQNEDISDIVQGLVAEYGYDEVAAAVRSTPRDNPARFSESVAIQSLMFDKEGFTRKEARAWAKAHDFLTTEIDESRNYYRMRQLSPSDIKPYTFRTIQLTDYVSATVGVPKRRS